MDKTKIISTLKGAFQSMRIARIKPTGVLATRALTMVIFIPILLVIVTYAMAFYIGVVSDADAKLISTGITIIDHIFIPSVLTALVGFLALWIDKDHNGIPDKLEEQPKLPALINEREGNKREKGV